MDKFTSNIKKCMDNYKMLDSTDLVVVGVSGGADSICLLNVLADMGVHVVACHLNHSIRLTGTAERDADFVRAECKRLGVEYRLKKVDIPAISKEQHLTEEEAGRIERYKFFNEVGQELSPGRYKIATGANLNDCVETLLMRLARGTTVSGLAGIPHVNGNIIRPLLDTNRDDIEKYLAEHKLTHITDETNLETEFTRNKVRLELIPYIKGNLNPNFMNTMVNNMKSYKEDAEYIDMQVEEAYEKYVDGNRIFRNGLNSLHRSISKRVLFKAIKKFIGSESISFNGVILDNIIDGLDKTGKTFVVDKNCVVYIDRNYVVLKDSMEEDNNAKQFAFGMFTTDAEYYNKGKKVIKVTEVVATTEIENTENVVYLPYEEFAGREFTVRTPMSGDRYIIKYEVMSQKLQKLLNDKKVDSSKRKELMVLACGNEVFSVKGVRSSMFNQRLGRFYKVEW